MQIRILHVVTYMGRGGLETMLMNYYRSIDRSLVQFDFLTHRDFRADYDDEIEALGGRIYRLPSLNPFSRSYLGALDRFFREHPEYRIVHSHLDCMAGIPLKYAKKHGVSVRIGHAHNSNQPRDAKYPLKLFYRRMIAGQATHLFACSEEAGRWMFGNADFRVLNNAIDAGRYAFDPAIRSEVRRELGLPADALVVGHVGRFDPQKNHRFLVEIFEKMPVDARLLLVGDGVLRPDVEQQAAALGIRDRILFTGVRTDVDRLLQAMDLFLMPSLFEGLPVSIVEAQAAGLPCLISDRVPIECKKTALVTQIRLDASPAEWAEAVLSAAKMLRENTLSQIREAGFDIRANAEWLQNYYRSFEV